MDDLYTVSEITAHIKGVLTAEFPSAAVRGQISNLRRAGGAGHIYFTLKDEGAQLPCAMWRSYAQRLRFAPEDGQEVVAAGYIDVYAKQGRYQLIVNHMQPLGVGELHVRFEELKKRLAAEGLFAVDRKRPLPLVASRVAVVTSPTSAGLRDFLRIARRRMPGACITLFPVPVQGDVAPRAVARAFEVLTAVGDFDVVVVTRGGGSIEDLWAFNEEVVARAIAGSPVPVVSAVGHETDTTIADYAADARAATPSEAAEMVFADSAELLARLAENRSRIEQAMTRRLARTRERLSALRSTHALARPLERLRRVGQDLDDWERRALDALGRRVRRARERVSATAAHLAAVSPVAILGRGYSITTREGDRVPLTGSAGILSGERLTTRLAHGRVVSEVVSAQEDGATS